MASAQRHVLFLSALASRSDWTDDGGEHHESGVAHEVYARVARVFKKQLSGPVWATNAKTGKVQVYKTVFCSSGAGAWEEAGGQLRQEGVENVTFSRQPPAA